MDDRVVDEAEFEKLLDEETLDTDLETSFETELVADDDEEPAFGEFRLLYIDNRDEPPQYSSGFAMQVRLQVLPVVARTLPAPREFPQ